jgi:hypothetical protein
MVQRLVHPPDILGSQSRRHRLDTFTLNRQQQPGAVRLQGINAVGVPGGLRQAIPVIWLVRMRR